MNIDSFEFVATPFTKTNYFDVHVLSVKGVDRYLTDSYVCKYLKSREHERTQDIFRKKNILNHKKSSENYEETEYPILQTDYLKDTKIDSTKIKETNKLQKNRIPEKKNNSLFCLNDFRKKSPSKTPKGKFDKIGAFTFYNPPKNESVGFRSPKTRKLAESIYKCVDNYETSMDFSLPSPPLPKIIQPRLVQQDLKNNKQMGIRYNPLNYHFDSFSSTRRRNIYGSKFEH